MQKKWHPTCFTCAHCFKPFGNAAFYLENGLPYCEQGRRRGTRQLRCSFDRSSDSRLEHAVHDEVRLLQVPDRGRRQVGGGARQRVPLELLQLHGKLSPSLTAVALLVRRRSHSTTEVAMAQASACFVGDT